MVFKQRYANYLKKLKNPKSLPIAQRVHIPIYVGDTIAIKPTAHRDANKQGQVIQVDTLNNRLLVKGLNLYVSHKKPGPGSKGGKVLMEQYLNHCDVELLDPLTKQAVQPKYTTVKIDGRKKRIRVDQFGNEVPIPFVNKYAEQKDGKKDTPLALVKKVTFQPRLGSNPFPVPLWNQILKLRRKGKENMML